jgi:crotonobetainyl-CoA:carnitine CoA-transferase CaiB-like acyl-CoA transferase
MDRTRLVEVSGHGRWRSDPDALISGRDPVLSTPWPVGDVAAVALAQVGAAAARLARSAGGDPREVRVDVADAAASTIGFGVMRVDGLPMSRTNAANPWVDRYRCGDGRWIHLHGGFPVLAARLAELFDLALDADESMIAAAVERWTSDSLEDAIAERRGCSAIVRDEAEWRRHPHGEVVHTLSCVERRGGGPSRLRWSPSPTRPLDGLRVVDLTRVLAGPTCGRTLAAFGADVLHVSGPTVPYVPAFVIDTGHGKRQAFCEFTDSTQLAALRRVAIDADVVVQGYRPGVVARVGLDEPSLRADGFGGVYATVSAFGPVGPWADRAGWEQLAQAASGLCLNPRGDERPTLLPCAFTDYTTGFVLAAAIMESLGSALDDGVAERVDASLCQTAAWILRVGRLAEAGTSAGPAPAMVRSITEFGVVDHLGPCVAVDGLVVGWSHPTTPLGHGALSW